MIKNKLKLLHSKMHKEGVRLLSYVRWEQDAKRADKVYNKNFPERLCGPAEPRGRI